MSDIEREELSDSSPEEEGMTPDSDGGDDEDKNPDGDSLSEY